jgi:hypothetical protein
MTIPKFNRGKRPYSYLSWISKNKGVSHYYTRPESKKLLWLTRLIFRGICTYHYKK